MKQAGQPITTGDVARAASVSRVTVSRVLNNHANVTDNVRRRVLQAAAQIGYIGSSASGQRLATNGASTRRLVVLRSIGFFFTSMQPGEAPASNPFWSHVLHGVEQEARAAGISVIYRSIGETVDGPAALLESPHGPRPDGVLLVGPAAEATVRALHRSTQPLVLVDNQIPGANVDAVLSDNFAGGRTAVQHLLALGHHEIAFIGGPFHLSPAPARHPSNSIWSIEQRALGYWTALREAGIEPNRALYVGDNLSTAGGYRACKRLLESGQRFTAIFCANDETAIGSIRALNEAGLAVPADVSVIGFDDIGVAGHLNPPLTTLRVDKEAIGAYAVRQLVARALAPAQVPATLTLGVELVQRHSTAPRRSQPRVSRPGER